MDNERVTTEQLLGERPCGSEPVRIRSQSEPPAGWAAAAEMIAAAHGSELPVSQCARSVPTSTLEMSPFDLESLALCSVSQPVIWAIDDVLVRYVSITQRGLWQRRAITW